MSEEKSNILLKEYELHRDELKLRIDHRIRGFTFLLSANIVALGLALKDNISQVFLMLPWFILGFLAYLGHQVMCAQLTISYLKDLEERLEYIDYQRSIADSQWHNMKIYKNPVTLLPFISLIPFILILAYSSYKSFILLKNILGVYFSCAYMLFLLILFVVAVLLIVHGVKNAKTLSNNRSYKREA